MSLLATRRHENAGAQCVKRCLGIAVNGAERKGFERVAFGHEATDAALELGVAVPAQLVRMRISVLMRWSGGSTVRPAHVSASLLFDHPPLAITVCMNLVRAVSERVGDTPSVTRSDDASDCNALASSHMTE